MSTDATLGFGSQIYTSPDNSAWTKVAQTIDVKGPETETAKVKITNNDSPNNSQEYVPGLFEPGDTEYETIYTKGGHAILDGFRLARSIVYFQEVFPDGSGYKFTGFVTKASIESKTENEAIHGKVTIAITTQALFMPAVS